MSYRKAKLLLQQKKLQEQQNIQPKKQEVKQDDDEAQEKSYKNNVFAAFENDSEEEQEEKKEVKLEAEKEEKEKNNESEGKKKNKKKKKKNKEKNQKPDSQEEVERAFKQFGMEYKKKNEDKKQQQMPQCFQILTINESKFNYEKQLRRHFGNVGPLTEQKQEEPDMTKRQQKLQKHLKKAMKKSVLSPGVKDVFIIREKFEIERNEDKIRFIPTKKYDHYQAEYEAIRNSNDVNALYMFTQTHPQHVDSLYAVGQFLRLQGDYRNADNLIQRVIYIYEMAATFDLNQFIKQQVVKKQVIYDSYSTSLFMSLFKFMDILGKKGCYRAALEYNKFLLKINLNDPTACMLCIDYNSISSKSSEFLLKFIQGFGKYIGNQKSSLYLLPNFIYSASLAKYYIENPQKTSQLVLEQNNNEALLKFNEEDWKAALVMPKGHEFVDESAKVLILRALLTYPRLIVQIAAKNDYAKQFLNFSSFEGNQKKTFKDLLLHEFWSIIPSSYSYYFLKLESIEDSTGLDKVLQVYVQRSKILWKSNQIMLWVKGAMGYILNKIDNKQFDYQEHLEKLCMQQGGGLPIPFNLRRYSKISKNNFTDRVDRIDLANIQDNQRQQNNPPQNENRMRLDGNPIAMFFQSLLPWVNLPRQQTNEDPDMPDIEQDD